LRGDRRWVVPTESGAAAEVRERTARKWVERFRAEGGPEGARLRAHTALRVRLHALLQADAESNTQVDGPVRY
jgi:hypothetical protein